MLDVKRDRILSGRWVISLVVVLLSVIFGGLFSLATEYLTVSVGLLTLLLGAIALIPILVTIEERWTLTLLFLVLAYPYRINFPLGPLNSFSIFEIMLFIAWAVLALRHFGNKRLAKAQTARLTPGNLDIVIFVYLMYNGLTFLWAESPELAVRGMIPIIENVALYYCLLLYGRKRPNVPHFTKLYLTIGAIAVMLAILFYFGGMSFLDTQPANTEIAQTTAQARLGSPVWGRSNYFATNLLLFLPAFLTTTLISSSHRQRVLSGVVSAVSLIVFLFTWSRGGLVALAASVVLLILLLLARRRQGYRATIFLLVLFAILSVVAQSVFSYISDTNPIAAQSMDRLGVLDDTNVEIRIYAWGQSWNQVWEKPLGLGVGNSAALGLTSVSNVHNAYLQSLVEVGWLGFIVFVALLSLMLRENWRFAVTSKGTPYEALSLGLLVSFIAILINIAGESSFEGVVFGWLFWTSQALVRILNQHLIQSRA